jgi:type IV pilus assembly protein PilX
MKRITTLHHTPYGKYSQQGVALLTTLIILLLSSIVVLGAFRVGFLNEILIGAEADHSRARAAAEALLRDAEMDIRGRRPPFDVLQANFQRGMPCRPDPAGSTTSLVVQADYRTFTDEAGIGGCRARQVANTPYIPDSIDDYEPVKTIVLAKQTADGNTFPCSQGICTPATMSELGDFHTNLTSAMMDQGVIYGQYTRQSLTAQGVEGNALLLKPGAATAANSTASAWYWIEIFTAPANSESEHVTTPGAPADPRDKYAAIKNRELIYRITAIARGRKAGTQVVLTSLFIPFPKYQN